MNGDLEDPSTCHGFARVPREKSGLRCSTTHRMSQSEVGDDLGFPLGNREDPDTMRRRTARVAAGKRAAVTPDFDDFIGMETRGAEREGLQGAHELLLQASPAPDPTSRLETTPKVGIARLPDQRVVKRRAVFVVAAAFSIVAVFAVGYAVASDRSGRTGSALPRTLTLTGTPALPGAHATLEVWHARGGNVPIDLHAVGLPRLPRRAYYEVFLVRDGRPWGSCGKFRVTSSTGAVTVSLNAPYALKKSDSWVVIRDRPGREARRTVLRAV
jgi:hypothetical protein